MLGTHSGIQELNTTKYADYSIMFFKWRKEKYLKENRLEEVLVMLQVLALDKRSYRSESGFKAILPDKPISSSSWIDLAREHPEFFRVADGMKFPVSLVTRHVSTDEEQNRPALSSEHTQALLNTAIELHDRELKRNQRWTVLIPIWAAVIGGFIILAGNWIDGTKETHNKSLNQNDEKSALPGNRGKRQ